MIFYAVDSLNFLRAPSDGSTHLPVPSAVLPAPSDVLPVLPAVFGLIFSIPLFFCSLPWSVLIGLLVVDGFGAHIVTAYAATDDGSSSSSDYVTRDITVVPRAASPVLSPPGGSFQKRLVVSALCSSGPDAQLFYTDSASSTPARDSSPSTTHRVAAVNGSAPASARIELAGRPGPRVVRAFCSAAGAGDSAVLQFEYQLVRPAVDEFPARRTEGMSVRPAVEVAVVAKALDAPAASRWGCAADRRDVRGNELITFPVPVLPCPCPSPCP